ncbi:RNA polymerase sigma factor SigW domain protein, partial [Teladorsagia circumcincta]
VKMVLFESDHCIFYQMLISEREELSERTEACKETKNSRNAQNIEGLLACKLKYIILNELQT